jgi:hypothetical protein
LNPFQVLAGLGALILLIVFAQLFLSSRGAARWHLEDMRAEREKNDRMREELRS